jgi:hypothetical protein
MDDRDFDLMDIGKWRFTRGQGLIPKSSPTIWGKGERAKFGK